MKFSLLLMWICTKLYSVNQYLKKTNFPLFCNKRIFNLILFITEKNIECCVNVDSVNEYLLYWETFYSLN